MTQTRRNFLKVFGGATVGVLASPLPCKLLDDLSIWTQNWSWIARPPLGPVGWAYSTCTLCPTGCSLRLRLIGDQPVSAWAVPGHPVSHGCICPTGLGSPQIRFHSTRITSAMQRVDNSDTPWHPMGDDEALADVGRRLSRLREAGNMDRAAILDLRPGRALSALYQEFLTQMGGGHYLTLPDGRDLAAATLTDLAGPLETSPCYDFQQAKAVISFGAPLLDDWCGAGPAAGLMRRDGKAPYLVQVESNLSVTASMAQRWLPLNPGTEVPLALSLAHVLLEMGSVDPTMQRRIADLEDSATPGYRQLVNEFSPEKTTKTTGIDPRVLRAVAQQLVSQGPALAVGGSHPGSGPLGHEEEAAIWGLNILLGSVGQKGAAPLRRPLPEVGTGTGSSIWDLPDGSLDLLIVDGANPGAAIPRDLLRRKLSGNGSLLVSMSPFIAGPAAQADLVLPIAAPGEWVDDVLPQSLSARSSYALATAITKPPSEACHPADLIDRLARAAGVETPGRTGAKRHADLIDRRVAELHSRGQGEVFDPKAGKSVPVSSFLSPEQLKRKLTKGGCWFEEPEERFASEEIRLLGPDGSLAPRFRELANGRLSASTSPLVIMPCGRQGTVGGGALPPVVNKIHRESHLRPEIGQALVNPTTAATHHLQDGHSATLSTTHGDMPVTVVFDETVMPGVVRMAIGPDPVSLGDPDDFAPDLLSICQAAESHIWRVVPASLKEV